MDIHNQPLPGPRPASSSKDWQPVDVTRVNRDWIQRSTEETIAEQQAKPSELDAAHKQRTEALARAQAARDAAQAALDKAAGRSDRLELSDEAQRLADEASRSGAEPSETELARLRELREQYESGTLNTYERMQKAADRMLGGS